ncbi:hypothetical protein GGF50DRAFT_120856 [Schizophyllum commune]
MRSQVVDEEISRRTKHLNPACLDLLDASIVYHYTAIGIIDPAPDLDVCLETVTRDSDILVSLISRAHSTRNYHALRCAITASVKDGFRPSPEFLVHEERDASDLLSYITSSIDKMLSGQTALPHWEYPISHADIYDARKFYDDLAIPVLNTSRDVPCMVLHDLRGDSGTQSRVNSLFRFQHGYLCDAPGSGKTRLLFEGLTKHWGLYMVCAKPGASAIGSLDLQSALGINLDAMGIPSTLSELRWWSSPVPSRIYAVFLARLSVLRILLDVLQKRGLSVEDDMYRIIWVRLQSDPALLSRGNKGDVFFDLARIMHNAERGDLGSLEQSVQREMLHIRDLLPAQEGSIDGLYIALDEAQDPARELGDAALLPPALQQHAVFYNAVAAPGQDTSPPGSSTIAPPSAAETQREGPPPSRVSVLSLLLTQIVHLLRESVQPWIILSGTRLAENDVVSAFGPFSDVAPYLAVGHTLLGGFDSDAQLNRFARAIFPPIYVRAASTKYLLTRVSKWLQGRYRFATEFFVLLMQNGCRSGHLLLDHFVRHYTNQLPSDGHLAVNVMTGERDCTEEPLGVLIQNAVQRVARLDFDRLERNPKLRDDFLYRMSRIVFDYLFRSSHALVVKGYDFTDLVVDIGMARYAPDEERPTHKRGRSDSASTTEDAASSPAENSTWVADVKEPLVLLGINDYLNNRPKGVHSAFQHFASNLKMDGNKKNGWEAFVFQGFVRLFSRPRDLADLLDFCGPGHEKLKGRTGEMVAMLDKDGQVHLACELTDQYGRAGAGPSRRPGCFTGEESGNFQQTLDWLKKRFTTVLLPDKMFGPDLFFILRLDNGKYIWVAVQCKYCTSGGSPHLLADKAIIRDAIRSTTPKFYYKKKEDSKKAGSSPQSAGSSEAKTAQEQSVEAQRKADLKKKQEAEDNEKNRLILEMLDALPNRELELAGDHSVLRVIAAGPEHAYLRRFLDDDDTHPLAEFNLDPLREDTLPLQPLDCLGEAVTTDVIEKLQDSGKLKLDLPPRSQLQQRYQAAWDYRMQQVRRVIPGVSIPKASIVHKVQITHSPNVDVASPGGSYPLAGPSTSADGAGGRTTKRQKRDH